MHLRQLPLPIAVFAGLLSTSNLALAAPPSGSGAQDPASSGATDVGGSGEFQTAEALPEDGAESDEDLDATELELSGGGIFSTGNSRNAAMTSALNFRLRRNIHQFGAVGAGNLGFAAFDRDSDWDQTVGNVQGQVRYDVFFAKRWSAFTQLTARHDPFQGLEYRMNVDPGFAFYAINKKDHRLWFEAGYDFQYDLRTDDSRINRDDDGNPILDMDGDVVREDKTFVNHAARLYAGYSNRLSDKVTFDTGLEYLQSFLDGNVFRLNYNAALSTQIKERFSLATTFTLRYENEPLPDVSKLDTITSVSLVYRFF